MGFDKRDTAKRYTPQDGDTLKKIAERETAAGNEMTWQDIALFNWGTDREGEANEFLRDELGAYKRDDQNNFEISADVEPKGNLLIPVRFSKEALSVDQTHVIRVKKTPPPPKQFEGCTSVKGAHFDFDSSFVRPSVVDDIRRLEQELEKYPDAKIMIFGHTDKVGGYDYNKGLSERRARSVYAFITDDAGVWEELYQEENWGLKVVQAILQDLGGEFDPGPVDGINGPKTQGAVTRYQKASGLVEDGIAGPNTRQALFTDYMTGKHDAKLAPDRFMDPKHMGCGEYNPMEDTEEECEANRRVTYYLFNENRLPTLPCSQGDRTPCTTQTSQPLPRHRASFHCSFYDSIARECPCEGGKILPAKPKKSVKPLIETESGAGAPPVAAMALAGEGGSGVQAAQAKVVLLDRTLSRHQAAGETKIQPDPTCIRVSLGESKKEPPYTKGGKLKGSPANVDVFLDEKCEKPLAGDLASGMPLTNEQLKTKGGLPLYLKGKTAGKFELTLELEDSGDPDVKVEEPAKEEMGVVDPRIKLHQHDAGALGGVQVDPNTDPVETYYTNLKNKKLPDQKEMTEEQKIKEGRLLHVQKDGNLGRAKLVLDKLDASQWPAGTDGYHLAISETHDDGAVEVFDAEEGGAKQAFPVKVKVSDLKSEAKTLWVQGKATSKKRLDVRLDLGVAPSGAGSPILRNGDWARFTVVEIKEVKVDYTPEANKAVAWDEAKETFQVNLKPDPNGRKVTIGAQLSEKFADVTIHFMLAPDKNNRKEANWGVDLPATWKWKDITWNLKRKDKKDPKDLMHLSAVTGADGYAKVELQLSRFGGDEFQPGAYLDQDPHLAKYVHGHADLEKRKPVFSTKRIKVRRRFWYQMTKAKGFNPPQPGAAEAAYREVRTEMILDQTREFEEATAPARTFYPEYVIAGGNSDTKVANVGDYNKNDIASNFFVTKTDQPVKNQLIVCTYQYDARKDGNLRSASGRSAAITAPAAGTEIKIVLNRAVFDPALHGVDMIRGLYWYRSSAPASRHNIPAGDARIPKPRANNREIAVKVPALNPAPTVADPVFIVARCWSPWGPYLGESFGKHSLIVYDPTDVADYNDTVVHEIGHRFNQTPDPGAQPGAPKIPNHPNQADRGQGNHCQVNDGVDAGSGETKYKCVMYDSGPMQWGLHEYCETCHPYLLVEDLHRP